jgi:hypothetical protein
VNRHRSTVRPAVRPTARLLAAPAIYRPSPRKPSEIYTVEQNKALWHNRMGHLGAQNLERLLKMVHGVDFAENHKDGLCVCETCLSTTGKRRLHNHKIEPGRHKLELIHSDVVGLIPVKGFDGSRYLVTFSVTRPNSHGST